MDQCLQSTLGLIAVADDSMQETNYSQDYMSKIQRVWKDLIGYLSQHHIPNFSKEVGQEFLEQCYGISKDVRHNRLKMSERTKRRAILILLNCQEYSKVNAPKQYPAYDFGVNYAGIFSSFLETRKQQVLAFSTIERDTRCLNRLASYLDSQGIIEIGLLKASHIIGFMESASSTQKLPTIRGTAHTLRILFHYLYGKDMTSTDLSSQVPIVKNAPHSVIPSSFSKVDIQCMLQSVDRGNPAGKRNYAILLLASKLGIRASDICNLTFENLKWETNTIEFIQKKTGKPAVLPLLNDAGEAIIDYIKFGRPKSKTSHVFLRHLTPVGPMRPASLHIIVTKQLHIADIVIPDGKRHGTHALRHSLAGVLLDNNTPLPIITEILAHADSNTTSAYLKIDLRHLRELSLGVPSWNPVWIGGAGR
ncbi:MAG: site-specific integrase [Candidatus Desantisbacteria bacterium]